VTITNDFHVEVSKRIKEEYENGREYYAFHGNKLTILPRNLTERPSAELIDWHNQKIYMP
jgi:putative restriction endonuclease